MTVATNAVAVNAARSPRLDTTRWAIVIPSFNHAEDVITCLESLLIAEAAPRRVFVVDDASTENAVERIVSWAVQTGVTHRVVDPGELSESITPVWLTVIAAKRNGGFSVSCNIGLKYVRDALDTPFALLLNNDAAVARDYFTRLADGIEQSPGVGLATGTIYEWDQKTVWYAGGRFNPFRAYGEHFLTVPADSASRPTEFVCGCTMLIARDVLVNVGVLPELYAPCYCEDAEYSLRVRNAGYDLIYVPTAKAFHRVSASLGREVRSPQVIYWFNRNRGYAVRRNFSGWRRATGIAYLALSKPLRALWELLRGRPESSIAFIKGTFAGLFDTIPHH